MGYEVAKAFASRGKNFIVVARRKSRLESLRNVILQAYPTLKIVMKVTDLSIIEHVYQLYEELNNYTIETWINNAGFGNYDCVAHQDLKKMETLLHVNVEAFTVLSSLFVRDYKDVEKTQLINISSAGDYTIVPNAITYCATKFFVGAFSEGLAHELKTTNAKMQVKVLAPAATKTEFGKVANNLDQYDYDEHVSSYHSSQQMANFLSELYDNNYVVGVLKRVTFVFQLCEPMFAYAGNSQPNQKDRSNKNT